MVRQAQQVLAHALAPNTRASYTSAFNHLDAFHRRLNVITTLPVSSDTLCLWMADSIDKLKFSSIRNYLHGIATLQQELGHPNPIAAPLVWRMFKAIKRLQGERVIKTRLPITITLLMQLNAHITETDLRHLCMRAAMWLGTCGLLRAGEFVTKPTNRHTLQFDHLTFHNADSAEIDPIGDRHAAVAYMSLRLDQSKTDPFRRGTNVIVGNERAISYMLRYLRRRNTTLKRVPLLLDPLTGQALSCASLVKFTQDLIKLAHLPNADQFLGHSFRKGGATSLHEAGHPDSLIKLMGRWASFAFASYVHTPLNMLVEAGRSLRKVEDLSHMTTTTFSSFWDVNSLA